MLFQQSFERIIGLFDTKFSQSQLIIFMKKLGPEKKVWIMLNSPDNRGSTVLIITGNC